MAVHVKSKALQIYQADLIWPNGPFKKIQVYAGASARDYAWMPIYNIGVNKRIFGVKNEYSLRFTEKVALRAPQI
jgi:hypothetical protein